MFAMGLQLEYRKLYLISNTSKKLYSKPCGNGCLVFYLAEERWFMVPVVQITFLHLVFCVAIANTTFKIVICQSSEVQPFANKIFEERK